MDSGVASMRATFSRAWVSSAKTNGMESRKKVLKFTRFPTMSANTWETTKNSDESTHFERAVPRFCTCACQEFLMISVQNHAFSTILLIRCEEMHFENRKQYSAPAGALTMFLDLGAFFFEPVHVFLDLTGWGNLDIETRCIQEVVDAGEIRILKQQQHVRSGGEAKGGSLRMKRNGCRKLRGT